MDINYLNEFRVLAEICNYQEAAEQLYISLSTLSKHISKLEAELGAALFDRTTRKVTLNKYGTVFYDYAVLITDSYLACTQKLEDLRLNETAMLRVALPPCLTEYNLPALLTDFMNTHPDMKITITESENAKNLLRENLCDIAFFTEYGKAKEDNFPFHLQLDTLIAILPADHPLSGEPFLTMDQLKKERFITKSDPSNELSLIFQKLCDDAGFKPKPACAVHYTSAMPKMVNAYKAVAITNRRHALLCDAPGLVIVELRPVVPYHVYLLCPDGQKHTAASQCFLDYMKANCQPLNQS